MSARSACDQFLYHILVNSTLCVQQVPLISCISILRGEATYPDTKLPQHHQNLHWILQDHQHLLFVELPDGHTGGRDGITMESCRGIVWVPSGNIWGMENFPVGRTVATWWESKTSKMSSNKEKTRLTVRNPIGSRCCWHGHIHPWEECLNNPRSNNFNETHFKQVRGESKNSTGNNANEKGSGNRIPMRSPI